MTNASPVANEGGFQRFLLLAAGVATLLSLALRLVRLEADFPPGISESSAPYTDEGWYSNSAVRLSLGGEWHVEGDFNPAVVMPAGAVIQRLLFNPLGTGLWQARLVSVAAWALAAAVIFLLGLRLAGGSAPADGDMNGAGRSSEGVTEGGAVGLLAALIFCLHQVGFAYSRLGIMEPVLVALILWAILVATLAGERTGALLAGAAGAGVLLAAAVLTKPTSIFAAPLLVWILMRQAGPTLRKRGVAAAAFAMAVILPTAGYYLSAAARYRTDLEYFRTINLSDRAHPDFSSWINGFGEILDEAEVLGDFFLGVTLVMTVAAFIVRPGLRRNPLALSMTAFVLLYTVLISSTTYLPTRYFVPLLAPLSILLAMSGMGIRRALIEGRFARFAPAPLALIAVVLAAETGMVARNLLRADHTLREMALAVRSVIDERELAQNDPETLVIGDISDTVSLITGIPAINLRYGTRPTEWRLREYQPEYLLAMGGREETAVIDAMKTSGWTLSLLGEWDVMENFREDEPVRLYALAPPAAHSAAPDPAEPAA